MPPFPRVTFIFALWLGAMGWLTVREVLPRFRAGEPPPFHFDLTDEVGTSHIEWKVIYRERQIGTATHQVRRQHDDTFEQTTHYRFDDFPFLPKVGFLRDLDVKTITIRYHVTGSGALLDMSIAGRAASSAGRAVPDYRTELKSQMENGLLQSEAVVYEDGVEKTRLAIPPVEASSMGNVGNPLHVQNRIPGLWIGRTWMLPEVDSFSAIFPIGGVSIPRLHAEVFPDTIEWLGKDVECFRIDHGELGKSVTARVWVRRRDSLVIKHEAEYLGRELVLLREPPK